MYAIALGVVCCGMPTIDGGQQTITSVAGNRPFYISPTEVAQ